MKIKYLAENRQFIPTICDWFHSEWNYLNPDRTKEQLLETLDKQLNCWYTTMEWRHFKSINHRAISVDLLTKETANK